jgi:hypothetical protein
MPENGKGDARLACWCSYLFEVACVRLRKVHQNGAYPIDFSLRR